MEAPGGSWSRSADGGSLPPAPRHGSLPLLHTYQKPSNYFKWVNWFCIIHLVHKPLELVTFYKSLCTFQMQLIFRPLGTFKTSELFLVRVANFNCFPFRQPSHLRSYCLLCLQSPLLGRASNPPPMDALNPSVSLHSLRCFLAYCFKRPDWQIKSNWFLIQFLLCF